VLKGVVRAERLENPSDYIGAILERVKPEYLTRQYLVTGWTDHVDFLTKIATRNGKLLKGGEPDINQVAVHVINDWQRGKLPYFVAPPKIPSDSPGDEDNDEQDDSPLVQNDLIHDIDDSKSDDNKVMSDGYVFEEYEKEEEEEQNDDNNGDSEPQPVVKTKRRNKKNKNNLSSNIKVRKVYKYFYLCDMMLKRRQTMLYSVIWS
jgi:nuclear GTP-binding protein